MKMKLLEAIQSRRSIRAFKYNHFLIEKVRSGEIWKPRPDPDTDMFTIHPKGPYAKRQGKLFKQVPDLLEPEEGKRKMQSWCGMTEEGGKKHERQ